MQNNIKTHKGEALWIKVSLEIKKASNFTTTDAELSNTEDYARVESQLEQRENEQFDYHQKKLLTQ